jgi:cytochrome c oxidase cbb3-type subunit III
LKKVAAILFACTSLLGACEREERSFQQAAPPEEPVALSVLAPGGEPPNLPPSQNVTKYENNAYSISEGKKLFSAFNCTGCHANGGGGSGPALIDDHWIYGSSIENIAATISEGRPNGMPSFRDKIPDQQIWQLAAFVRSLGALTPKDVASGRSDDMQAAPSENRMIPDPFGLTNAPATSGPTSVPSPAGPAGTAPQGP